MATLRKTASEYADEIREGTAWVIVWKTDRSWNAQAFWLTCDKNETFEEDDLPEVREILRQDPNAVMLNGYYCGHFGEDMTVDELAAGIRWHYENGCNRVNGSTALPDEAPAPELPVYGYVNGEPVYSRDDFDFKARGRGPIEDDEELIAFAEKVTGGWYNAGWRRSFTGYYLGDYALDEPKRSLTAQEYARLRELQKQAQAALKAADEAREWKLKGRYGYADNSVEEVYVDKDGVEKRVMVVAPHGDAC